MLMLREHVYFFFVDKQPFQLLSVTRNKITLGYIDLNLINYIGRIILYLNTTFIQKFGLPSQDMSSIVVTPMGMVDIPYALNFLNPSKIPSTTFLIELGDTHCFPREFVTSYASLSIMMSFSLTSHACITASSTAFASASIPPKGSSSFLLKAPIISPLSFLMTTSTPQHLISSNIAPSVLTLYQPGFGGLHTLSLGAGVFSADWFATWNSFKYSVASLTIISWLLHYPPCLTWFLLFHKPHIVVASKS